MDVHALRQEIPATARTVYMNTGWSGPSPRAVLEAVREVLEQEAQEGPTAPPVMARRNAIVSKAREVAARFIGATPEELVLTDNTTHGLNLVLGGLRWRRGDEVVTATVEHGSLLVPLLYLRRRVGVRVRAVPIGPQDSAEEIVERVGAAFTARTRLLAISHIQYTTGQLMPLRELHELAHARGARVLVDGAQSAGHVPVDVRALDADYYAWPAHKWVLGPDGVGALYVRRELLEELEPAFTSGSAAQSYSHEAKRLVARRDTPRKFELTTASTALRAGFVAALEFLERVGQEAIWERNRALGAKARARLSAVPGVRVVSPLEGPLTTGLVAFRVEGVAPQRLVGRLWQEGRIVARSVRYPEPAVRLSLDFFNTEEEVEQVGALVQDLARRRGR